MTIGFLYTTYIVVAMGLLIKLANYIYTFIHHKWQTKRKKGKQTKQCVPYRKLD